MRDFAQELVDQIIDYIADDRDPSMAACGLVSKSWLTRPFTRIELTDKDDDFHSFLDLVDASSLPLLSFVQSLGLVFTKGHVEECDYITFLGSPSFVFGLSVAVLAHILKALPFLEVLRIESNARGNPNDESVLPSNTFPPHLRSLESGYHATKPFFSYLLAYLVLPIFTSLALSGFLNTTGRSETYLSRTSHHITALALDFTADDRTYAFEQRVLPLMINLLHLKLSQQTPRRVPTVLSMLTSSGLITITIVVSLQEWLKRDNLVDWRYVEDILAHPRFSALQSISIMEINYGHLFSMITAEGRALMPEADARGILR
ncbi:hypothetical protein C8R43DRAFT_1124002 [Mycena crocata]|nr:hypothetical protein C8R43DRAFT_1124002 [Mycena crocata]